MTNNELRENDATRLTKKSHPIYLSFDIRHSFGVRHLDFVI
jgi:hypothetical protein